MSKILKRSVLLLIASGVLLIVVFKGRSPFGKSNSSFACDPEKEITKIEFLEQGNSLYLENTGDKWLINSNLEARRSEVLFLVRVLKELKIKSPVSAEIFEKEIIAKEIPAIKVSIYAKRKLLKTFLVYKTSSNTYGNIMKMKEGGKPFIVYVPGYEGNIGSGFTVNELFWQPYTVFNLLPSEIKSVDFENLSDTASSFSILNRNNHFVLSNIKGDLRGWDSTLVIRYLSYFTRIPFEAWAFELEEGERQGIEFQKPLYRITVTTIENIKTVLTMWERVTDENGKIDSDRLFGKTQNSNELFVLRYFDIDPLIKKRSYFFPE